MGKKYLLQNIVKHSFLSIFLILFSCSSSHKTIGILNNTNQNILIETAPQVRYNGYPEKYMRLSGDSIIWDYDVLGIDAKVLKHTQDSGIYYMRPFSTFKIGSKYIENKMDKDLSWEDIDLNNVKIYLPNGSIIFANSKKEIWALLLKNKFKMKRRIGQEKRYFKSFDLVLTIEETN